MRNCIKRLVNSTIIDLNSMINDGKVSEHLPAPSRVPDASWRKLTITAGKHLQSNHLQKSTKTKNTSTAFALCECHGNNREPMG